MSRAQKDRITNTMLAAISFMQIIRLSQTVAVDAFSPIKLIRYIIDGNITYRTHS